jgi:hypothetical protein
VEIAEKFPTEEGGALNRDIFPIFVVNLEQGGMSGFRGTGFLIADGLLVTCWHCVSEPLKDGEVLVAARETGKGDYDASELHEVTQDSNGADLATAKVEFKQEAGLKLAMQAPATGTDVWTYGYPLTTPRLEDGKLRFQLNARWIEGYITRSFRFESPRYGEIPVFELDMITHEGLSGAPLVRRPGMEVLGVILGRYEVGAIEEFASVDPETGERRPEVQRVVSFGLAHYTSTLAELQTDATDGKRLADYARPS